MASNGGTFALSGSGDRILHVDDTLRASLNVRRELLEIQIQDTQAPLARRWVSILVDRISGDVVSGTGRDGNAAWREAREALR